MDQFGPTHVVIEALNGVSTLIINTLLNFYEHKIILIREKIGKKDSKFLQYT